MLISICIPTYNSGDKLNRLLDSIQLQSFKDFEIIISDDSSNADVKENIEKHYSHLQIKYYYNQQPLGTPSNWNNAVAKSSGEWIKIMHHDDWFNGNDALLTFANAIKINNKAKLIFCSYKNVNLDNGNTYDVIATSFDIFLLKQNYINLFKNFIGNPSCTLIHSSIKPYNYDASIKWFIDFDFYLWYFKTYKFFTYIKAPLITFAIHKNQVTAQVQNNPTIEIPETFLLFEKYGISLLHNIFAYDFFWRMFRNLKLKNIDEVEQYLGKKNTYDAVADLIKIQNSGINKYLHIGIVSKIIMLYAYTKNRV